MCSMSVLEDERTRTQKIMDSILTQSTQIENGRGPGIQRRIASFVLETNRNIGIPFFR